MTQPRVYSNSQARCSITIEPMEEFCCRYNANRFAIGQLFLVYLFAPRVSPITLFAGLICRCWRGTLGLGC